MKNSAETTENRLKRLSIFLSFLLRHKPDVIDLKLDSAGWTPVSDLLESLSKHDHQLTLDELRTIVQTSDKRRFSFSDDGLKIRANQGHSFPVELGYEPASPPSVLLHGTATRNISSIKSQGLLKRARHHVHMTESEQMAIDVGTRYGKPCLLVIDALAMSREGHQFFRSENDVWLTDHVPPKFIQYKDVKI